MAFKDPVIVEFLPDGRNVRVNKSFSYYTENTTITVEAGFVSDGASIPKIVWRIIGSPLTGRYRNAALLHDFIYSKALFSRKECDKLFYEAMGVLGVAQWRRWIMYKMVRLFGWIGWRQYRRQEEEKKPVEDNLNDCIRWNDWM